MPCYQCGNPDGSEAQLCKACLAERVANYQTIREQLLQNTLRWEHYWTIIKEEWYLGVGVIIMILFGGYFIISFLMRPHEVQIHLDSGGQTLPQVDTNWQPDYASEQVYNACLEVLQRVDTSQLDANAIISAYEDTYKRELEELDKKNPKDPEGRPLSMLAKILFIRAQESCQNAKTHCDTDLRSSSCRRFANEYLNKETPPTP